MGDNGKTITPSWKGYVILGIVNIILVLLLTKLNMILISATMILIIVCLVAGAFQSMKEDWKAGFKLSALGCLIGMLLSVFAGLLYVVNVFAGLGSLFVQLFSMF